MYRINKVCIYLLLLLIFSAGSMSAQVVTMPSGYPVIDLSALNPLGAVLSSTEAASRHAQIKQQTPSNTDFLSAGSSVSGQNGSWNARMSIKYQVMRADLEVTVDWAAAWKACASYNGEGGGTGSWRLPTQRELLMIWILHPQLIGKGHFTAFFAGGYWSATEYSTNNVWRVYFGNGTVGTSNKTNSFYVRCVRDL
ncbi:DUF1566 domain-containing protein [Parabacteroides sp. GYB001]|uniref:Lcl C-terminal domain-containing protein n=1 Tax=Parabacteroides leei TaxID=2939491 RepID=UPI002017351A|nr:DUF1566 domain-containing protein [Parabacteroides leei]MCL3849853.1 DUF1566 domain-containing protein [Parabacteroides leei]